MSVTAAESAFLSQVSNGDVDGRETFECVPQHGLLFLGVLLELGTRADVLVFIVDHFLKHETGHQPGKNGSHETLQTIASHGHTLGLDDLQLVTKVAENSEVQHLLNDGGISALLDDLCDSDEVLTELPKSQE